MKVSEVDAILERIDALAADLSELRTHLMRVTPPLETTDRREGWFIGEATMYLGEVTKAVDRARPYL